MLTLDDGTTVLHVGPDPDSKGGVWTKVIARNGDRLAHALVPAEIDDPVAQLVSDAEANGRTPFAEAWSRTRKTGRRD